jgi:hypothetical protein
METWLPVPDYEGLYLVSDQGLVRSLPRATTKGRILKRGHDPNGYPQVTLSKDGKHKCIRVHVLVLTAFRGPRPPGTEGAHENGNKEDCQVVNLFWKTKGANILDAVRHGTHHNGSKTRCRWGHRFTEQSTRMTPKNQRVCRICDRTRSCKAVGRCGLKTHDHVNTPWSVPPPF